MAVPRSSTPGRETSSSLTAASGTRQRVGGERVPVEERLRPVGGVERGHDVRPGQGHGQREDAAGQGFRRADQVRGDAGVLERPAFPGPVAGHHLVGDEQDAVPLRRFGQVAERVGRVHPHPAGPLDQRFDDHAPRPHGPRAREELVEPTRVERQSDGVEQERLERAEEQPVPADGHRPERVAVVGVVEPDEQFSRGFVAVAPELIGHLQGDFDRRAAVVRKEHPAIVPGSRPQDQFGEPHRVRVGDPGEQDVIDSVGRRPEGGHQRRVAVPVEDRPPR